MSKQEVKEMKNQYSVFFSNPVKPKEFDFVQELPPETSRNHVLKQRNSSVPSAYLESAKQKLS